jgi:hypothetical protein
MTDPKKPAQPESDVDKAARIARVEAAVKKAKTTKGIMPTTPEEVQRADGLADQMDQAQRRHEKEYRGLKIPPKNSSGPSR